MFYLKICNLRMLFLMSLHIAQLKLLNNEKKIPIIYFPFHSSYESTSIDILYNIKFNYQHVCFSSHVFNQNTTNIPNKSQNMNLSFLKFLLLNHHCIVLLLSFLVSNIYETTRVQRTCQKPSSRKSDDLYSPTKHFQLFSSE